MNWINHLEPLASEWIPFDTDKYYHLRVEIKNGASSPHADGDEIKCYLNGKSIFDIADDSFAAGKAGIRTNTDARFDSVRIWMTREAHSKLKVEAIENAAKIKLLKEKYPQPSALIREIQTEGNLSSLSILPTEPSLIVAQMESGLMSFDLDGNEIWRDSLKPTANPVVSNINADGKPELVCFENGKLIVLDGITGKVKRDREIDVENISSIYAAEEHILVLNPPYRGAQAFDGELNPLWKLPDIEHGGAGAIINFGAQELRFIVGHTLLDFRGKTIWQTQDAWRRINPFQPRAIAVGKYHGEVRIAMACAKLGLLILDLDGNVLHEIHAGDVRTLCAGKFCGDEDSIWLCTWWGNYGIRRLYDFNGKELTSFEPNNISTQPFKVRWIKDKDLMLDISSAKTFGLYDELRNFVVPFPGDANPKAIAIGDFNGDGIDKVVISDGKKIRIYTS